MLTRVAAKLTDLDCIRESLMDANAWFRRIQQEAAALGIDILVPDYIIKDTAYFADLCTGIINHAPRITRQQRGD